MARKSAIMCSRVAFATIYVINTLCNIFRDNFIKYLPDCRYMEKKSIEVLISGKVMARGVEEKMKGKEENF